MKKTLIRFGFALAVTSTAFGGVAAVNAPAHGDAVATKQWCC